MHCHMLADFKFIKQLCYLQLAYAYFWWHGMRGDVHWTNQYLLIIIIHIILTAWINYKNKSKCYILLLATTDMWSPKCVGMLAEIHGYEKVIFFMHISVLYVMAQQTLAGTRAGVVRWGPQWSLSRIKANLICFLGATEVASPLGGSCPCG